jgi:hypothetical protein
MQAIIRRSSGGYTVVPNLDRLWVASLRFGAHIGRVRRELPTLLAEFERRDWIDFFVYERARENGFREQLDGLGVTELYCQPQTLQTQAGGFALVPEPTWNYGPRPDLSAFISDWLSDQDKVASTRVVCGRPW